MAIKIQAPERLPVTVEEMVNFLEHTPYINRFRHSIYDDNDIRR